MGEKALGSIIKADLYALGLRSEASPFVWAFLPLKLIFRSRVATRVSKYITLDRYIFRVQFLTWSSIFEHLPVRFETSSDHC